MLLRLLGFSLLLTTPASSNQESVRQLGRITIVIDGLRDSVGSVRIGLWNRDDGFPFHPEKVIASGRAQIREGSAVVELDYIPAGLYAASAFHDENDNGKLDTNLIHIPKEGFGFSNNAQGKLGPPSFQAAAFRFTGEKETIKIDIKYLFERG